MPWWRRQSDRARRSERLAAGKAGETATGRETATDRVEASADGTVSDLDALLSASAHLASFTPQVPTQSSRRHDVQPMAMARVIESLRRLGIRYLTDEEQNLLAMWERHALLITLEGPDGEILVMRARAHGTVPPDWADRAYAAVNEWNHTRRFLKSYVGDPNERGVLPLYAEMQIPLVPGIHDALLDELIDCAAAVSGSWTDWLHSEALLL